MTTIDKKTKIKLYLLSHPTATDSEICTELEVSKSYVSRVRKEIEEQKPRVIYRTEWRDRTHPWLYVLLLVLVTAILLLVRNCSNDLSTSRTKQSKLDSLEYVATVWRDKYNDEHIKVRQLEVSYNQNKSKLDSVARLLKIKPSSIKSISVAESSIQFDTILIIDTAWIEGELVYNFHWEDNYIQVKGWAGEEDGQIDICGTDTIQYVEYTKRKNIFSEKKSYVDISNKNPYIHFTGLKSFTTSRQNPKWIVGPSISVGYTLKGIQPVVGISTIYYPLSLKFY